MASTAVALCGLIIEIFLLKLDFFSPFLFFFCLLCRCVWSNGMRCAKMIERRFVCNRSFVRLFAGLFAFVCLCLRASYYIITYHTASHLWSLHIAMSRSLNYLVEKQCNSFTSLFAAYITCHWACGKSNSWDFVAVACMHVRWSSAVRP